MFLGAMDVTNSPSGGVVHDIPEDFGLALMGEPEALKLWENITPLARNEWICWISSAVQEKTRQKRILWGLENLKVGKRRPCCWPGCPHRAKVNKPVK
jgi:uncharacterized protein YdeI (YjbR/CyaY-like superfamily)